MNDPQGIPETVAHRALDDIREALATKMTAAGKLTRIAQIAQAAGVVPFVPSYPRVEAHLREVGSATIQEIADALALPLGTVVADLGTMHDLGRASRYGADPDSIARWDS